ncbi:hypothetical protein [Sinomicrobium pectinilyticum]|uniref:hypothetical protein n=1 Tax=Sinomicrobium pectinilyticum TaxID=1084421 RepID=UPI00147597EE|nr:hypothetical protein [Sinomicrobium pectinilyticum]
MKKIYIIVFTVTLNLVLFSCDPDDNEASQLPGTEDVQGCCDDDVPILPPPNPPGNGGN